MDLVAGRLDSLIPAALEVGRRTVAVVLGPAGTAKQQDRISTFDNSAPDPCGSTGVPGPRASFVGPRAFLNTKSLPLRRLSSEVALQCPHGCVHGLPPSTINAQRLPWPAVPWSGGPCAVAAQSFNHQISTLNHLVAPLCTTLHQFAVISAMRSNGSGGEKLICISKSSAPSNQILPNIPRPNRSFPWPPGMRIERFCCWRTAEALRRLPRRPIILRHEFRSSRPPPIDLIAN